MPLPRFRKRCLNAYPYRRERSQNYDNGTAYPNFFSGSPSNIFRQDWTGFGAVAFTLSTAVAIWTPTQRDVGGTIVVDNTDPMFDALGNILGIRRSGLPSYSIVGLKITPIVFNIDKAHSARIENVIFDANVLSTQNPSVSISAECAVTGAAGGQISCDVTLSSLTLANLNIRESGVVVATTSITNAYAGASTLKLLVGQWSGTRRLYTASFTNILGTQQISYNTTLQGVAANTYPRWGLTWGNGGTTIDATTVQMGSLEYDGFVI